MFGGIERGTGKSFFVPVDTHDADTLLRIIRKRIEPGTTIVSNCWKAYRSLGEAGFEHLTVNHSIEFVDARTGTHTNTIECQWREVRCRVPRFGVRKKHFEGYLAEYLFKAKYPPFERLHHFFF